MDFVALDFETANHRADSPCQLALVIVESNQIVAEKSWLIRPKRLYFSPQCIAVHGIQPEDVRDQPEWDVVWEQVLSMLEGRVLVAHNAGFDLRVLNATLATYDLACPELEYTCTRLIARRTWPGRTGYGLKPTADALGIAFKHHDALEDSRACAQIAMAAAKHAGASCLDELESRLSITRGRLRYGVMTGPRCLRRKAATRHGDDFEMSAPMKAFRRDGFPEAQGKAKLRKNCVNSILQNVGDRLPLQKRSVVLNGSLLGLERVDAVLFLERLGARVQPKINLETDFLIVGHETKGSRGEGVEIGAPDAMVIPERTEQVQERQRQGQPIRILSQRQLLALIPGGLEIARTIANGQESIR